MPLLGSLSAIGSAYSAQLVYVTESAQSVSEGTTVTFTINSSGIADGTTLYYTSTGTVSDNDLSSGALTGSVVLGNSSNTISMTFSNDLATEGNETIKIDIRQDSASGPIIAQSQVVTIIDTSTAPYGSIYYSGQPTGVGSGGLSTTKYWTVPAGVTSISVVCIGSGAPGSYLDSFLVGSGGGGGALSYVNNVSVTPGETLTINIGWSPNGASYYQAGNTWVTRASGEFVCGAQRGNQNSMSVQSGTRTGTSNTTPAYRMISTSSYITGSTYNAKSHGGGPGGVGGSGTQNGTTYKGGGGGAGGYGSGGGYGGYDFSGTAYGGGSGTNGAGGGGGAGTTAGGPGGGASLYGNTATNSGGALSTTGGTGGGGTAGANTGVGSTYGGGGGSAASQSAWSNTYVQGLGGRSGVRIVYPGISRQFPSTDVASTTNESNPA